MNRLLHRVSSPLTERQSSSEFSLAEQNFRLPFPYRLFTPEHYEARYPYPLVVWLHSHQSSEYELDSVIPHLSLRNYMAIAIRGTQSQADDPRRFSWSTSTAGMNRVEERVIEAIHQVRESLSINPHRVFLAGHGVGGTLAQWIGLRQSFPFAGVVSFNGPYPRAPRTLVRWKAARTIPVLFAYGDRSTTCDAKEVCRSLRHVHSGGLRYQFAQFSSDDSLDTAMTGMANRFMMQLVAESSAIRYPALQEESVAIRRDEP